jgi:zinc transporter
MKKENGLIHAFILDGQGAGKRIDWKHARDWKPADGLLWMHMDYSHPEVEKWIRKKSGLNMVAARTLLAGDTRPNVVPQKEGLLITLRGVHLQPGANPEDMVAIRIWIEEGRILSTQKRPLLSIDSICREIDEGIGPKNQLEFITQLTSKLAKRITEVVDEIDERVDEIQEQVLTLENAELRSQLSDLRRRAISIRRYLAPQREALNLLAQGKSMPMDDLQRMHLIEISNHMVRLLENLDTARERATVTNEELVNRLSEQINKRIYILSIVAAIFLPLSFLTGLLGINVGGIPGAENKSAFLYVCIIIGLIVVIQAWFLKKSKWM